MAEGVQDHRTRRRLLRLQILGAALAAAALATALARAVYVAPSVAFLDRSDAPWIVAPTPLQTHGMAIDRAAPPTSDFERSFDVPPGHGPILLHVRALREVTLLLNGRPLPLPAAGADAWRRVRSLDLAPHVVPGANVLFARVRNPDGNPALQLWIEGLPERVETDARWKSAWLGDPVDWAELAADSLRHPDAAALPTPAASLRALAVPLALAAITGALLFAWVRTASPRITTRAPAVALALLALFWAGFALRVVGHPPEVGFDARAHLDYVAWLGTHASLPHPREGSAMYHPPLYHAATAALLALAPSTPGVERAVALLLPLAAGFGLALVAGALARALRPHAPWLQAGSALIAGLLPMNLVVASCPSNEGPFALLAAAALLVAVRALLRPVPRLRDDVVLGLVLGAAALTKYSSLLWIPLLLGAVLAKRWLADPAGRARALGGAAIAGALVLALAGWVYARNAALTGLPLVWNLDADPSRSWWQLPGFHTTDYYARFGDALVRPWFASFHSFWDALYTTLWGDGLLSGATGPREAWPRWRLDAMAAGFALAVPANAFVLAGWLRAVRAAFADADLGRRVAWSLVAVLPPLLLASIASVSLHYAFWSVAKSFYALAATPILALCLALGVEALDRRLSAAPLALRALPFAWAAAWLAAIAWSFAG